MGRPKIRHLAIFVRDPAKIAKFYQDVFEMELLGEPEAKGAHYVTDGNLTLALLPHKLAASAAHGLNHFGFTVPDRVTIMKKLVDAGTEEPKKRPADRPYAEYRGVDPEGNWFDLSEHGYDEAETADARETAKASSN
jgi:catechol 2,3-dioxygenase-like lactoylglutathione lyase family enzyme